MVGWGHADAEAHRSGQGALSQPMSGWLSLPSELPDEDVSAWTDRARDHIATLPPKVKKPKK